MRTLILGNNYSAQSFYEILSKNKNDIVFSNCTGILNHITYDSMEDIADFCEANEINLVIPTQEYYMNSNLQDRLNSANITFFSPSEEAISISKYKSCAKKFINKNKFLAPKFFIAEKPNLAMDYIKNAQYPLAIRPETHNAQECTQFAETYSSAQKIINKFFENGNKKVIIEDYIQGKNVEIWVISDGYSAKIIGANAKYQNNISILEPEFLASEMRENLLNTVINPAISSLASDEDEYIGILGFDFILNNNGAYLVGFNSFFDDISVDFYTKCQDLNWFEIMNSCIIGDIFTRFEFKTSDEYALTIRYKNKIELINAKIKSNLDKYIVELGYDTDEYKEAVKLWKY